MITATIGTLPSGTMGFDCTVPLTPANIQQYLDRDYGFVVRYVGRKDGLRTFVDLSATEAQFIVDSGLGLCVVQHPLAAPWSPTVERGQAFGTAAAELATAAGLLAGTSVFLDLEGVASASQAQDVLDFCNTWYAQVFAAGYVPGLYIGADPGLTADQMYWDLKMKSYWRGGSSVNSGVPADIPNRGYQMTQRITGSGATEFDLDVIETDNFGGAVQWCVSQ